MSGATVQQMAERVAALMAERLGADGATAADRLERGGRRLPRRLRADAAVLAEAARHARDPRLLAALDVERVAAAYDRLVRHLAATRRRSPLQGVARSILLSLLIVAGVVLAVLTWRGFL